MRAGGRARLYLFLSRVGVLSNWHVVFWYFFGHRARGVLPYSPALNLDVYLVKRSFEIRFDNP